MLEFKLDDGRKLMLVDLSKVLQVSVSGSYTRIDLGTSTWYVQESLASLQQYFPDFIWASENGVLQWGLRTTGITSYRQRPDKPDQLRVWYGDLETAVTATFEEFTENFSRYREQQAKQLSAMLINPLPMGVDVNWSRHRGFKLPEDLTASLELPPDGTGLGEKPLS